MPKRRKPSNLVPEKTMRIFCEGEKTEPIYVNGYLQNSVNSGRKSVIRIEKTRKNTPIQLVEAAISAKQSPNSLPDDEFWVVYDREAVSKYSHVLHSEARQKAVGQGINIALSNVCFEYWLLLHLIDTQAPYSSHTNLRTTSPFLDEFKLQTGKDYGKSSAETFSLLREWIPLARERAKRLNQNGHDNAVSPKNAQHHINPYVGVVDLLDAIDDFD
ncbi:RloB family protein [Pontixanthobacter aestiaquae]|uniref:RloB domain-containing protein n=1 Tax=Pontixanthobacter aestiaquae TaxID=1509367 RepID=A0A844Z8H7_9SPHN|nr:RloB family protein [Pontixanthobacter aestiaquae]MDN3645206.1 RloB family protein [Pontixanthobacter aestiaquae]MXO83794.1 RloB domain-containing protein [Pontixanthobacter aestiaquae]